MKKLHPNIVTLLADIEAYRALSGEDRTAFGLNAMKDGNFITRIEHGRQPSFTTIDRVYEYINRRTKAVNNRARK
jgi:hypothetical protein